MGKIFRLAMANIRKGKGQASSFILIILIGALMLYLGMVTAFEYVDNFDKKAEQLCSPDLVFSAQTDSREFTEEFTGRLLEDDRVAEVESGPVLIADCKFSYGGGEQNRVGVVLDKSRDVKLAKWAMVEESGLAGEYAIYLPYLFQTAGVSGIGDDFDISFNRLGLPEEKMRFTVAGFYEDTYFSTINNTTTGFLMDHEGYERLAEALGDSVRGTLVSVNAVNAEDAERIVSNYKTIMKELLPAGRIGDSSHYEVVKSARTITSSIGSIVIVAFSILLIAIALVVVKFRIGNSVEEEMQNIGALKAIGYTSRQIIFSFLIQFSFLALIGSLLGLLGGFLVLPLLSHMFATQTGILWKLAFSVPAALATVAGIQLPVLLVAFMSANRVRRLHPITALRFGVTTHSFRRNPFPLEKARGSLNLLLAAKQLAHNKIRSFLVGAIIAVVTFAAVFAGVLYMNISVKEEIFLNLTMGDTVNVRLRAKAEEYTAELLAEVRAEENVKKSFYYFEGTAVCEDDYEVYCYVADDFEQVENRGWNYKGRFAKYENEVCLGGLLAKKLGKDVGDTLTLRLNDVEQEYLITGLIQGSNYLGQDLCLTGDGYRRLAENFRYTDISVYLREGTDSAAFIEEMEASSDNIALSINREALVKSSMGIYSVIIGILAKIIDLITALVVVLVLYLVIKTTLNRQKRELAIKKAIGFTTGQLALQNACSFLPVIMAGSAVGCVCGYLLINPFLSLLFARVGLVKVEFLIPAAMLAGIFAAITGVGFTVSLLVSARIRRITPYTLLCE